MQTFRVVAGALFACQDNGKCCGKCSEVVPMVVRSGLTKKQAEKEAAKFRTGLTANITWTVVPETC